MSTQIETTTLLRIGVVVYDLDAKMKEYSRIYGISDWETGEHAPTDAVAHGRRLATTPGTWRSAVGTTPAVNGEKGPGGRPASSLTFELVEPTGGESPFNEFLRTKREGIAFLQVRSTAADDAAVAKHFETLGYDVAYTATVDGTTRTFFDTREKLGGFLVEMLPATAEGPAQVSTDTRPTQPVQGMYHFGVLVHDVMAALPHYRDVFGIQRYEMKTWETGFGRLDKPYYRGKDGDTGYFTAQGTAGDFGFEIISVNHGDCHYNREFFDERGPGIHHYFAWMTTEDTEWDEVVASMTEAGHPLCMGSDLRGGAAEFGYFDTFDALGGYLIEIVVRREPPKPEFAAPDWVVDFEELV